MTKIKLWHFIWGLHNGGVEKVIQNYFSNMDTSPFELHVVTHMENDPQCEEDFRNLGFQIHRLSPMHGHKITKTNIKEYKNLFEKNKMDVIHNHFPNYLLPLYFAKKYNVPVRILHSHNDYNAAFYKSNKLNRALYQVGLKYNASNATVLFACGERAAKTAFGKTMTKKELHIITNAINVQKFIFNKTKRQKMREELQLGSSLTLGHIGRYDDSQKNQEFVLKVFHKLLDKIPDAKLLMLGEGKFRNECMKTAEQLGFADHVNFTGSVNNVPDYLQAMDIFVFPSRFEGLGIVLIEAQTSGLYCIASDKVPAESKVTEHMKFLTIEDTEPWIKEICAFKSIDRTNMLEQVTKAGYDIAVQASALSELYIKLFNNANE